MLVLSASHVTGLLSVTVTVGRLPVAVGGLTDAHGTASAKHTLTGNVDAEVGAAPHLVPNTFRAQARFGDSAVAMQWLPLDIATVLVDLEMAYTAVYLILSMPAPHRSPIHTSLFCGTLQPGQSTAFAEVGVMPLLKLVMLAHFAALEAARQ